MAARYYYFRAEAFNLTAVQALVPAPAGLTVVAPGITQSSFLVVTLADDTPPNETDLLEAMASFGFSFVASTLVAPVFGEVRHFGALAAPPTVPALTESDRYYDTTIGSEQVYSGGAWGAVGAAGAPMTFFGTGYYREASGIDVQERNVALTIGTVVLRREIAGTAGTTEVDVLVNGVSMFLLANRPKVLFSAGDAARVLVIPDFPSIPAAARVEMDIVTVEDGNPQDITVLLFPA